MTDHRNLLRELRDDETRAGRRCMECGLYDDVRTALCDVALAALDAEEYGMDSLTVTEGRMIAALNSLRAALLAVGTK